jgi:hypothetical protein
LKWTKAGDAVSAEHELKYCIYRSTGNNIGTVAECEANGTLIDTGFDLISCVSTGLIADTTYYFNVVVADKAGNKAAYTMKSLTTQAKTIYSIIVNNGFANPAEAEDGVTVTITADSFRPAVIVIRNGS